ncbi:MAG TPA: hypothetical protein PKD24_17155 [Pyrinomonadaceae bacterium]|nr:hypothetical protein [Pyrinomonadaceae bacterium]HMP66728.1 hypothetical protein [Pyrinomonadaceae bacterium]
MFFLSSADAQERSPEDDLCNVEYAGFLVSQLVSESRAVREPEKRIRILIRSADFVWPFAETDARDYFTEAYKAAVAHYREKGIEDKTPSRGLMIPGTDYRFEVVRAIAKRDGAWARKLADEILAEFEKAAKDRNEGDQSREIGLMLQMAAENAEADPDLAWYLLRRVMRYPLDQHWLFSVYSISRANPSMATALYQELLMNYRSETPRRLLFLSAFPFGRDRIFGIDKFQLGMSVPEGFAPNAELQRQFLEVFFERIQTYAANPEERLRPPDQFRQPEPVYMVSALSEIEPLVINDLPFLLPRLSAARALANSLLTEEMHRGMKGREQSTSNLRLSFDERFAQMDEAEKEGKLTDLMIVNLMFWGGKTEEQFVKLEPWLDKIRDEEVRRETTNYYWFLRAQLAIKEGRFPDAERHAAKVPEIEHRALLAFELAEAQMKSINDVSSAYQTLGQLGTVVRKTENSATKAKLLLGLSSLYEKLNPNFAIDELAEAVRVMNRLENPDMLSTQIFRQIKGKDYGFFSVFSIPGQGIEGTFRKMGEIEFGLSLSNARAIDDRFLRTIAVLAVAGNCVDREPKAVQAETGSGN